MRQAGSGGKKMSDDERSGEGKKKAPMWKHRDFWYLDLISVEL
jgi:hypothetical protein